MTREELDQKKFEFEVEKQKLIVMQSSLDRATQIALTVQDMTGVGEDATLKVVKRIALELYNFVFDTASQRVTTEKAKVVVKEPEIVPIGSVPVPTQQQATWLQNMAGALLTKNYDFKGQKIEAIVWNKYKAYPRTVESVKQMYSELLEAK